MQTAPNEVTDGSLVPWFALQNRIALDKTVVFGHWAALEGYRSSDIIGLDTGCVWGGTLTLLRWKTKRTLNNPHYATTIKQQKARSLRAFSFAH